MGAAAKVRELGPQSELVVSDKEMSCADEGPPMNKMGRQKRRET